MSSLSDREREAVAVGAAIGAGCRPCTRYHVKAALEAGLTEDELRLALKDAEVVRVELATSIAAYAAQLLGDERRHADRFCTPTEPLQALVQVGAAAGGNGGYLLDWLLPQARGLGLANEALAEALTLAANVKTAAAHFFDKDAQRALGRPGEVAALTDDGGCAATAQCPDAEPAKPVEAAPRSCC